MVIDTGLRMWNSTISLDPGLQGEGPSRYGKTPLGSKGSPCPYLLRRSFGRLFHQVNEIGRAELAQCRQIVRSCLHDGVELLLNDPEPPIV